MFRLERTALRSPPPHTIVMDATTRNIFIAQHAAMVREAARQLDDVQH